MIARNLYTEIWTDSFFNSLSIAEKLLFIYFLTNDQVNIIHLYKCPIHRIKSDTGIDTPIIEKAKVKFEKFGKIYFNGEYVFLKNGNKFEKYSGEKNELAKAKLIAHLSENISDWYNKIKNTPMIPLSYPHDTPSIGSNININTSINTHTSNSIDSISSKNSLVPCTQEELYAIADKLNISDSAVKDKHETILEYVEAGEFGPGGKYKKNKTTYLTLLKWLRGDLAKGYLHHMTAEDLVFREAERTPTPDWILETLKTF